MPPKDSAAASPGAPSAGPGSWLRLARSVRWGTPTEDMAAVNARMETTGKLTAIAYDAHPDWVWPFWMVRQSDPTSPSFVPRGHGRGMVNLTHRNWTAVGPLNYPCEGTVDARGLVTPQPGRWSVDVWVGSDGIIHVPARVQSVIQRAGLPLPEVTTEWQAGDLTVATTVTPTRLEGGAWLVLRVSLQSAVPCPGTLHFAVRPYNAEGLAPIRKLGFRGQTFDIDGSMGPAFPQPPDRIACQNEQGGDVFFNPDESGLPRVACPSGLATGLASFDFAAGPDASPVFFACLPLQERPFIDACPALDEREHYRLEQVDRWSERLEAGMQVHLPDEHLERAIQQGLAHLHLLDDGGKCTPGPATYHYYWAGDMPGAAAAFDVWGYSAQAEAVLEYLLRELNAAPWTAHREGTFGQTLWAAARHGLIAAGSGFLQRNDILLQSLAARVTGPDLAARSRGGSRERRVGAGGRRLAEQIWAAAGLRELAALARASGMGRLAHDWELSYQEQMRKVEAALQTGKSSVRLQALYPAQLFQPQSALFATTLAAVVQGYLRGGAFHSNQGQSGFDPVLGLAAAGCLMLDNDPRVTGVLAWTLQHATPTFTWPQMIHPMTGGGCAGDGHYLPATAMFLRVIRDMLVREDGETLAIGSQMPAGWFEPGRTIRVWQAPTRFGTVGYTIRAGEGRAEIEFDGEMAAPPQNICWQVPFQIESAEVDGGEAFHRPRSIVLLARSKRAVLKWKRG